MAEQCYPCKCCTFWTLSNPQQGSYEICPVCFWEDDDVQNDDPEFTGGANHVSLSAARLNYLRYGACEREFIRQVRPPALGEFPPTRILDGLERPEYRREQQIQILALSRAIRHGTIGISEGSREIAALRSSLDQPELEAALLMFVGIASELDATLVTGKTRDLWDQSKLAILDCQVAEYESRMRGQVLEACKIAEALLVADLLAVDAT